MFNSRSIGTLVLIVTGMALFAPEVTRAADSDVDRLVAAMLAETPLAEDLRELTDEIGGRPTGSKANLASAEWSIKKFEKAGVTVRKEAFTMPQIWLERSCEARISGDVSFAVRVASMPFSIPTPKDGFKAPLLAIGRGTEEDFERLGDAVEGAFILIEMPLLLDVEGLFREYADTASIERLAIEAGAAGVVYMSSRADGVLFRHNAWLGPENKHPILAMERGQAQRVLRLLQAGEELDLRTRIELEPEGQAESYNVIGEIAGSDKADEIVIIGAHLDSWGLGTRANDNGCNVAMMIDIARQMKRLDIRPSRTIRFALWNGEEQGFHGSWAYVVDHADELDRHVMAGSIDIGSGRITGFFTNGRPEIIDPVEQALSSVRGLGPFEQVDIPIVGTDNYDKVDLRQLRLNAAIVAAVVYGFAEADVTWKRQTREEVQALIDGTDLGDEMRTFHLMAGWEDGLRGRQ